MALVYGSDVRYAGEGDANVTVVRKRGDAVEKGDREKYFPEYVDEQAMLDAFLVLDDSLLPENAPMSTSDVQQEALRAFLSVPEDEQQQAAENRVAADNEGPLGQNQAADDAAAKAAAQSKPEHGEQRAAKAAQQSEPAKAADKK